jgi:hypothetical protein
MVLFRQKAAAIFWGGLKGLNLKRLSVAAPDAPPS